MPKPVVNVYATYATPTYPTESLTVSYQGKHYSNPVTTEVPGDDIHQTLFAARHGLQTALETAAKTTKETLKSANIVTASLGVLYTDIGQDEGEIESFEFAHKGIYTPAKIDKPLLLNAGYFFKEADNYAAADVPKNKSLRNTDFNAHLKSHIARYNEIKQPQVKAVLNAGNIRDIDAQAASSQMHEVFHHSEQALMYYLSSKEGLKFCQDFIKRLKPTFVSGIVLDLYSDRCLCVNCATGMIGFQHTQCSGFAKNLADALEKKKIDTYRKGLSIHTRVSARSKVEVTIEESEDEVTAPPTIKRTDKHVVLEAQRKTYTPAMMAQGLQNFTGEYFSSRALKGNKAQQSLLYTPAGARRA